MIMSILTNAPDPIEFSYFKRRNTTLHISKCMGYVKQFHHMQHHVIPMDERTVLACFSFGTKILLSNLTATKNCRLPVL